MPAISPPPAIFETMATKTPKPRWKLDTSTPSAQLRAEKSPVKAQLILDSDSDSDSNSGRDYHSATEAPEGGFKINEEYAKRFEHNKKREELQRLEEKYGPNTKPGFNSSEDGSDSEEEDETAVLATIKLDREIAATLNAIRKKDPRVYDGKTTFYSAIEEETSAEDANKLKEEKSIFLKDYHLANLLSGTTGGEETGKRTFVQEQADLKSTVVKEMHAAAENSDDDDDDDEGGGFLTRKSKPEIPKDLPIEVPDPSLAEKDPEEFLNKFLNSRAWAASAPHPALLSDDSEEEETAEAFEKAYNFRFENPDVDARSTLVSYGRDAISANTVRREGKSARKVARERKHEKKEREKEEREREKGRLRKLKTEGFMAKFKMIQEAAGLEGGEEVEAEILEKLLEGDFSDEQWEEWMAGRFGDEYYKAGEDGRPKKPEFDDDIDIADIVPDFEEEETPLALEEESEEGEVEGGVPLNVGDNKEQGDEDEETSKKRKGKKDIQREERKKKQKDKQLKRKVEKYIDDNYNFEEQMPEPSSGKTRGFRYRETTPEAYGLTPLDILAATDQDLNSFVGLKKLAPFREPDKKKRDKKRYAKKKRLREWRKEVFGDERGIAMPTSWKPEGMVSKKQTGAGETDIVERRDGGGEGGRSKKRRRKNKS